MESLKDLGTCIMEKRENGLYSEQDVHNVLLMKYEATRCEDFLHVENQSSVRRKK